uniref:EGF-like domain-containing protein n=1 Tax=Heterorhabditis bacteriophora TaxID=37862 RepID=A0A1I7XCV2_HETBA
MLHIKYKALSFCQKDSTSDMADESDFRDANNLDLFKKKGHLLNPLAHLFYLNEQGSKSIREKGDVRVVSINNMTQFVTSIHSVTQVAQVQKEVYGLCRKPKYNQSPTCKFTLFYLLNLEEEFVLSARNTTLQSGESALISCAHPNISTVHTITCTQRGQFYPHPTMLECKLPAYDLIESEEETPDNREYRDSCDECYRTGTKSCIKEEGRGYKCICKEGWTRFSCWKSPNLCSPSICGEHGRCRSKVDTIECVCKLGYGGSFCEVERRNVTWAGKKTANILSSSTIGSAIVAGGNVITITLKAVGKVLISNEDVFLLPSYIVPTWNPVFKILLNFYPHTPNVVANFLRARGEYGNQKEWKKANQAGKTGKGRITTVASNNTASLNGIRSVYCPTVSKTSVWRAQKANRKSIHQAGKNEEVSDSSSRSQESQDGFTHAHMPWTSE